MTDKNPPLFELERVLHEITALEQTGENPERVEEVRNAIATSTPFYAMWVSDWGVYVLYPKSEQRGE
jgi:hypothetical protein